MLTAVTVLAMALPVGSVQTDPFLSLSTAEAVDTANGAWLRVGGAYPEAGLTQLPFPLQLLVRETTTGAGYARYDLATGEVFSGTEAGLADGLDIADAEALLAGGGFSDGVLLQLGPAVIEVRLPIDFLAGPAEALLFVVDDEGGVTELVLSNIVEVQVPGDAP